MDEKRLNMDILKEVLHGKRPHNDTLFLKWLDESGEHQRLYEEALTRAARDLYIKESFDRKGVWNKVLNETSKHDRVRFMRRRFMRYAAVMLPFVAMVAWWLLNTGDAGQKVIETERI